MNLRLKLKLLSGQDVHLILPVGLYGGRMEGKDTHEIESSIKHKTAETANVATRPAIKLFINQLFCRKVISISFIE